MGWSLRRSRTQFRLPIALVTTLRGNDGSDRLGRWREVPITYGSLGPGITDPRRALMTAQTAEQQVIEDVSKWWWLWLVIGALWIIIALVILQFESASVRTVGILIGLMFMIAGAQYVVIGTLASGWKWLWYVFGILLGVAGIVALVNPSETFAVLADMLGFLFALVGIVWTVEAFATKEDNELWWLGLIAGILMIILGFWTGGQFFITKAYTLLVFAGIWALMKGILDIVRAFQIRKLGKISASL